MPRNSSLHWSMTGTRHGSGVQLNARSSTGKADSAREQKMNTFGRRFSTATCLGFVVLQFLLYACKAEAGEIRIEPQTQHLLLHVDRTATFFCQAVGVDALWSVNGESVPAQGNHTLKEMGWIFNETVVPDTTIERYNVHNMTLRIPADIQFNNTRIACIGYIHSATFSKEVLLLIKAIYLSIEPNNIYAPPTFYTIQNQSTTFYCEAIGNTAYWIINGETAPKEGTSELMDKGFIFNFMKPKPDPMGDGHVSIFHNTLRLSTSIEHNNTAVHCFVFVGNHRTVISNSVEVLVMGAPSSPVPIPVFNSPGKMTLEWDVPFSWPEYPVQSYDVVASNRSALNRDDINETRVLFIARPSDNQRECEAIELKVRASSDLGDGEYGSVIAGFPIEPQLMDNSIESINTSPQGNGPSQVSMKIKLPRVCSYQSTSYTVTITSNDLDETKSDSTTTPSPVSRGPFNGSVTSDSVMFTEHLEEGKAYKVNVEFNSDVLSEPLMVYKIIYIEPPTQPVPPTGSLTQQSLPIQYIIIGGVVGGTVLLLVIIVIIIVITATHVRRRRSMRSWSPSSNGKRPMVTNPIYDGGPVYETIPPGPRTPLRLHSNSESSNVTATSSVPPTPTSSLPPVPPSMESPYAYPPNQVDPTYAQPHRNGHVNFSFEEASYMIMSGVQSTTELEGKRLSEGEESNLDHDGDSGDARYVPEPRQPYASASMV